MNPIKTTKDLLEVAEALSNKIMGEKQVSLAVDCMNGLGIYEATIKADNRFSKWVTSTLRHGTIEFDALEVYKISSTCLSPPYLGVIRENITKVGNKLILDLKPMLKCDLFRIEVAYRMTDEDFLKSLVRSRYSPEPLREKLKYELSAQLRNPAGLKMGFSEIEIEEFPVTARVHIRNNLNTGVPDYIKKLFKIDYEITDERNPYDARKIMNLQREKVRLLRKLGRDTNLLEKIQQLAVFLNPSNFLNYIDRSELADFRLHNCKEDEFFTALGTLALPKTMAVISRTDLTYEKPAAKGTLIYKSEELEQAVAKLF
jgi:hypothetical protein